MGTFKSVLFIGGAFHEQHCKVNSVGGVLPSIFVMEVEKKSALHQKNLNFAHYRLANVNNLICYRLIGYSPDSKTITWKPTHVDHSDRP